MDEMVSTVGSDNTSTKWAHSSYSVSVFPPLSPSELSMGYDRNLRFGSLCGRWEAVFTDPEIQG